MKKNIFDFDSAKYPGLNYYLLRIKNKEIRPLVANFFERSNVSTIPKKELQKLIDAINEDVEKGVFDVNNNKYNGNVSNAFNHMNEEQLNSKTHQIFLKIIKNYFGKSAWKTLEQRKNLNIFNLSEVQVLHQKIFDELGEEFVNRIINLDLTPHSLFLIKDILSKEDKMADFKYFYNFYEKNIGFSRVNFEKMVREYKEYQPLIRDLRKNNKKITDTQKSALVEVLKDIDNRHNVRSVKDLNSFYEMKNKEYQLAKKKAEGLLKRGDNKQAIDTLADAIFKNYFAMDMLGHRKWAYYLSQNKPQIIKEYFDMEGILDNEDGLATIFSESEIEGIKGILKILDIVEKSQTKDDYSKLLEYAVNLEKNGNIVEGNYLGIIDKLPQAFEHNMMKTISTVEEIDKRAKSDEVGIYVEKKPRTIEGNAITSPVYVFDGADFSFLSTTNYVNGLSGNGVVGDFASSWFEYENGASHVCCSFTNQDCLNNLEFNHYNDLLGCGDIQVTYLFDEAKILIMSPSDINSSKEARVSDVFASDNTRFVSASKLIKNTTFGNYNEVDIDRFDFSKHSKFGGKIIPSAILCSDEIGDVQAKTAEEFTKFCLENGLKPKGWKMPIVVVKKSEYTELAKKHKKMLAAKNSEYFANKESKNQENIDNEKEIEAKQEKTTTR